eukprot:TRINITY_DN9871_c0_g1_i1.p1 TRINITY_DN9871_c0_g1~~TRINITY_DN9871_c0_g1_i1.p1  ORF type:complete len:234 (-),score=26.79 TRINITY_DN9871_c0_g1_i1:24-680(-)
MEQRNNRIIIDWQGLNYPPLIRAFHYDLAELSPLPKVMKLASFQRYVYFASLAICFFNLVVNIIVTASGVEGSGSWSFTSLLVLLGMFCFGGFMHIHMFRAIGTGSEKRCMVILVMQAIYCVTMFIFSLLSAEGFEGWTNISRINSLDGSYVGWMVTTVIESSLWTIAAVCQGILLYMFYQFKDNERKQIYSSSTNVGNQAKNKFKSGMMKAATGGIL